ncbi:helix-turn-helix transcriptional regulator [Amycolatopsis vancoresmycina]|uniref:DeoR family transcriptional regulator n=1 Tax=Amycolatopsis vancoresmycina DSM 44592 TaxID=1292037 RepID=R1HS86_9PSEU|nr:YafY family protein [Amycolatopsis vancoresmycina]EOD63201.1 DeoR family transcriptional regulator [Amycolatopsis vancoresmycina DSM 44592]
MKTVSARLLQVLSLLQVRPSWTGQELAGRLGVSPRTVRSDIEKLRELGYPVHAVRGVAGGYRLVPGAKLPPLLLDDDEATAVAIGLNSAAGGAVAGIEDAAARALAKLDQVLPARLRHRIGLLRTSTVTPPHGGPAVAPGVLTVIAAACSDHHRLRFDYRAREGSDQRRAVEPHRLVHLGRRWYLVGWDLDRAGWRTFRVDRMQPRTPTGPRFMPRVPPEDDLAAYVTRGVDAALFRYRARVLVHKPAAELVDWLPPSIAVEAVDDHTCLAHVGADTPHLLAATVLAIDADFQVDGPPELLDALRTIGDRCSAAGR